jgi:hypothetical protein
MRGHLLKPRLNEARLVAGLPERGDDPVDAVARIGENLLHLPIPEASHQVVTDGLRHRFLLT